MANLTDTVVPNITVNGSFDGGDLSSNPIGISGYKSDGGGSNTTAGMIGFNGIRTNVGGITPSNTNSRFTVPINGVYVLWFRNIGNNVGTTSVTYFRVNGVNIPCRAYGRSVEFNYPQTLAFTIVDLSAGDYVEYYKDTAAMYQSATDYVQFGIYRIGG